MIFYRILDSKLYEVNEVEHLGFSSDIPYFIPDEYLQAECFSVTRTCLGLGDFGIISTMPRLLKTRFPDCTVTVPSEKLLRKLFGHLSSMWSVSIYSALVIWKIHMSFIIYVPSPFLYILFSKPKDFVYSW